MSATYEPGTVAVATVRGVPNVRVVRGDGHWAIAANTDDYIMDRHSEGLVTDVRPLVVLDIDFWPPFIIKFLRGEISIINNEQRSCTNAVADQIEAQTRPPKPVEPVGLGAVVEDSEGACWVRCSRDGSDSTADDWQRAGYHDERDGRRWFFWREVDAVRVLSEGVQA